ncbi:MAG TPA: 3-keto-5-aminohexanoate cleavage protein [Gemmatimonadota bacterium]
MLLEAALNGARAPAEHPALPVTPEQLAREGKASVRAGAGAIHLHVRDGAGAESLEPDDLALTIRAVRAACPGVPVGISTGAWIVPDPERRLALARRWTALPDFASVNFGEEGSSELAELLLGLGVGIEAGLAWEADARRFTESASARRCLRILLEPGEETLEAALRTVAGIERVLDGARTPSRRLLHGFGPVAWRLIAEAARRGGERRS